MTAELSGTRSVVSLLASVRRAIWVRPRSRSEECSRVSLEGRGCCLLQQGEAAPGAESSTTHQGRVLARIVKPDRHALLDRQQVEQADLADLGLGLEHDVLRQRVAVGRVGPGNGGDLLPPPPRFEPSVQGRRCRTSCERWGRTGMTMTRGTTKAGTLIGSSASSSRVGKVGACGRSRCESWPAPEHTV